MKKNKKDVLEMISVFQRKLENNHLSTDQMYQEVRMMHFKIKPVQGDISILNLENRHFIEILWSLGKLDEFFQFHIEKLPADQKDLFYRLLDELYYKYQSQLNDLDLKRERNADTSAGFEMEIYKDKPVKSN